MPNRISVWDISRPRISLPVISVQVLLSDRVFYETSGGGVTLSGGEPTAQPEF